MSRSVKKGPFCAPELLKRVEEINASGQEKVLKTWSRSLHHLPLLRRPHHRRLQWQRKFMSPSMSPRIWSAISWVNSLPPGPSRVTAAAKPSKEERK